MLALRVLSHLLSLSDAWRGRRLGVRLRVGWSSSVGFSSLSHRLSWTPVGGFLRCLVVRFVTQRCKWFVLKFACCLCSLPTVLHVAPPLFHQTRSLSNTMSARSPRSQVVVDIVLLSSGVELSMEVLCDSYVTSRFHLFGDLTDLCPSL